MEKLKISVNKEDIIYEGISTSNSYIYIPKEYLFDYFFIIYYENKEIYRDNIELVINRLYCDKVRGIKRGIKLKKRNDNEKCIIVKYKDYDISKLYLEVPIKSILFNKKVSKLKNNYLSDGYHLVYIIFYNDMINKDNNNIYITIDSMELKKINDIKFIKKYIGKKCMIVGVD